MTERVKRGLLYVAAVWVGVPFLLILLSVLKIWMLLTVGLLIISAAIFLAGYLEA